MYFYNLISILIERYLKSPVAYPRFDLKRPVFIRWSQRGKPPFQYPANRVERRSGPGVPESETWTPSPSRLMRTSPDIELFALHLRMAGVLGSGPMITHHPDARQQTVHDASVAPVRISMKTRARKLSTEVDHCKRWNLATRTAS